MLLCLYATLSLRTVKSLYRNLQKPSLPSKNPGYALVVMTPLQFSLSNEALLTAA